LCIIFTVTYDLNPLKAYNALPTNFRAALSEDPPQWRLINKENEGCTNGGKYNGLRFIYQDDSSISVLTDLDGNAVGIQMNVCGLYI